MLNVAQLIPPMNIERSVTGPIIACHLPHPRNHSKEKVKVTQRIVWTRNKDVCL
jgi:hypothetical protein